MLTVRKGSSGGAVKLLQQELDAWGYRPGAADGRFGARTDRAVRQFQAAQGLRVDGIVGDRTWSLLLAGPPAAPPVDLVEEERDALRKQVTVGGDRAAVLESAIATLGWREVPDGSNGGPEIDKISTGYLPASFGKPPWCALYVSYVLQVGLGKTKYDDIPFGSRFGAVSQIEGWGKAQKRFVRARSSTVAPPAAIFTMGRSGSGSDPSVAITAGHTGFVVADDGAKVLTLEGNTGNAVASRTRRKSTLRGWVSWW